MNNRLYISLAGAVALIFAMCGCIKNDLPYGKVPLSITAFSVSGQTGDAVISEKDMTVTVNLEETANPAKSELLNIEYKATLRDGSDNNYHNNIESNIRKGDVLDLTHSLDVKLSLFQEYNWKIVPVQNIEGCSRLPIRWVNRCLTPNIKWLWHIFRKICLSPEQNFRT